MAILRKHLGTQYHGISEYAYFSSEDGLHVYQVKVAHGNSNLPVWMCSLSSWENAIHRVCNSGDKYDTVAA